MVTEDFETRVVHDEVPDGEDVDIEPACGVPAADAGENGYKWLVKVGVGADCKSTEQALYLHPEVPVVSLACT